MDPGTVQFRGKCLICGKAIDEGDFERLQVCAIADASGSLFFCVDHVDPAKVNIQSADYRETTEKIALAIIAHMQKS